MPRRRGSIRTPSLREHTRAAGPVEPRRRLTAARYVVIEGPIGVGKTTLTQLLAKRLQARTVFEVVEENPFLPAFYIDREKYAFQTQIFFLLSRFRQQQSLFQQDLLNPVTVSDYLFAKDRIFASLTLNRDELGLYDRIFEELRPRVVKPDLVIYLRARLDVLLGRIRKRGREFESQFDAEYLASLSASYNEFFARYDETPLLIADTSDANLVSDAGEIEHMLGTIDSHQSGVLHYVPVAMHSAR